MAGGVLSKCVHALVHNCWATPNKVEPETLIRGCKFDSCRYVNDTLARVNAILSAPL